MCRFWVIHVWDLKIVGLVNFRRFFKKEIKMEYV